MSIDPFWSREDFKKLLAELAKKAGGKRRRRPCPLLPGAKYNGSHAPPLRRGPRPLARRTGHARLRRVPGGPGARRTPRSRLPPGSRPRGGGTLNPPTDPPLSEPQRRTIFAALVDAQDRGVEVAPPGTEVAGRFGVSVSRTAHSP